MRGTLHGMMSARLLTFKRKKMTPIQVKHGRGISLFHVFMVQKISGPFCVLQKIRNKRAKNLFWVWFGPRRLIGFG
jgi:hypothetical protein